MSVWLAMIVAFALYHPDWASERYPTMSQMLVSSRSVPFILGVYCYYLRGSITPAMRAVLITLFPAGLAGIVALPGTDLKVASSAVAAVSLLAFVVSRRSQPNEP